MKKLSCCLLVLILVLGCNPDEPEPKPWVPDGLIGKWKTIAIFDTDGNGDPKWRFYQSDKEYDIWYKENGEYASFAFINNDKCNNGTYSVNKNYDLTYYTPCSGTSIVHIESLLGDTLIIDANHFETIKNKSVKVKK